MRSFPFCRETDKSHAHSFVECPVAEEPERPQQRTGCRKVGGGFSGNCAGRSWAARRIEMRRRADRNCRAGAGCAPRQYGILLQSLRYDEHRADDLLQGFREQSPRAALIGQADPNAGDSALFFWRPLIGTWSISIAAAPRERSPRGRMVDIDEHRDTLSSSRPTDAFDVASARGSARRGALDDAAAVRADRSHGPVEVFDVRYLKPATEDVEPEPHESIAQRLNLESPQQAANLLVTAKRHVSRVYSCPSSRDTPPIRRKCGRKCPSFGGFPSASR